MFQLTWDEISLLKSQFVISNDPRTKASRSRIVILKPLANLNKAAAELAVKIQRNFEELGI